MRIFDEKLSESELRLLATNESVAEILQTPSEERTVNQRHKLRTYYLENHASEEFHRAALMVDSLQEELEKHLRSYPSLMIMDELDEPRLTFVLNRGQYDSLGEEVEPAIPDVFTRSSEGVPPNRLGLAQWLVDPENPLTARVAVNRLWQMSFDRGLVRTVEDFGVQGEGPSHPELLDWLATEFIRKGWDQKAVRRLIVNSATYRQQSHATAKLVSVDPENRLLARGPRFRLAAEEIRDAALHVSGLLVEQLGDLR